MRLATEDAENRPTPGRFVGLRRGAVAIEVDGHEVVLWNHECERIAEAVRASGGALEYQPRWGLLWVPSASGRYAFCVTRTLDAYLPCPSTPPEGTPSELLESAGGFTVRVADLDEAAPRETNT